MSIITEDVKKIVSDIDFSQLQDKRVLVTGASGLIGVYMVACLKEIQTKYNIELYVWLNNPIEEQFSDIFNGCITITGDITNYNHPQFRLDCPFDYILHLAGYGQPNKFLNNKTKTIALNTTGTLNLFSNLNKNGKFLIIAVFAILVKKNTLP